MPGKRSILLAAGVVAVLFASRPAPSLAENGNRSSPPNILFILTDDQGWSQTSAQIHPDVPESRSSYLNTPNMNRIASEGMRFTSGYAPAPLCTPTRRSILCGTSAARSGTEFASPWVPAEHMTIPRALKQANDAYRCAHFGKWGERMISSPEECGYDASDGHTGNVTGGMANKQKEFHIEEDPKRTDSVTQRAVRFMRDQHEAGHPFYVQVSYYAVHLRVEVHEDTLKKYEQRGTPDRRYTPAWAAMLEDLDRGIGQLLAALDELQIAESTYVVFMTDNGGRGTIPGGGQDRLPTNHPLSGAKHSLLEGGIRVPFFVRGPGIEAGSHCHLPVSGYDLLPTFHDLAGGTQTLPDSVDGGSFAALLTNPEEGTVERPADALIFHRPRRRMSAIREGRYKLFVEWNANGKIRSTALFDVHADPAESNDLSASDPERAARLRKMLTDYLAAVDAEQPMAQRQRKK
ncbi:Choline-sulfatase [Maioricimonas rarisocia]|uniref:Choline-sulfatase n=1 Tax=Maioricimonas rarisocia TaxID=2528026 RepID=A0A517Z780_9PLAN|nr:Choline-sulfatase [Maioricimonas rarisocia]